jgi:hypothetical protein
LLTARDLGCPINPELLQIAGGCPNFTCITGKPQEALPASVPARLQTSGEALNFNPHLHGMLAEGLFMPDGSFVPFGELDCEKLCSIFCDRVLAALHKKELISDDDVAQILSQQHTGFSFWCGEPFQDPDSERFVARYIERGPVSLEKLTITDDIITYTTKDGTVHEFDALEFLALLSCQIPRSYESLTRYYGYYSCRARGKRNKQAQQEQLNAQTSEELPARPSSSWAACIKKVFEINPLECPKCKSQMRIVAFLHDSHEISKIMQSLGIEKSRPPPPIPDYSSHDESMFRDYIPNYD